MAQILRVSPCGPGHWEIIVERDNYSYKGVWPRMTSTTYFRYTTTDSMSVDDYRSDDERRQKRGEKSLIRQARVWGDKHIMRYE